MLNFGDLFCEKERIVFKGTLKGGKLTPNNGATPIEPGTPCKQSFDNVYETYRERDFYLVLVRNEKVGSNSYFVELDRKTEDGKWTRILGVANILTNKLIKITIANDLSGFLSIHDIECCSVLILELSGIGLGSGSEIVENSDDIRVTSEKKRAAAIGCDLC